MSALNRFASLPCEFAPDEGAHRLMMARGSLMLLRATRPAAAPILEAPRRKPWRPVVHPITPGLFAREIIGAVASAFCISVPELKGVGRYTDLVLARSVVIRLLRERTWANGQPRYSFPQIGRMLNRDHSTVIHSFNTFGERCERYPEMFDVYESLREAAVAAAVPE